MQRATCYVLVVHLHRELLLNIFILSFMMHVFSLSSLFMFVFPCILFKICILHLNANKNEYAQSSIMHILILYHANIQSYMHNLCTIANTRVYMTLTSCVTSNIYSHEWTSSPTPTPTPTPWLLSFCIRSKSCGIPLEQKWSSLPEPGIFLVLNLDSNTFILGLYINAFI